MNTVGVEDRSGDRLALRRLVDAYAHHADRREPHAQADLFSEDGRVRLYDADPAAHEPMDEVRGRDALAATFAALMAQYERTTYLNGQSSVDFDGPDAATGETYCMAFHVLLEGEQRYVVTMAIRYLDRFVRVGDHWLIADRRLIFDWTERRSSAS